MGLSPHFALSVARLMQRDCPVSCVDKKNSLACTPYLIVLAVYNGANSYFMTRPGLVAKLLISQ